ncbi:hypothetical protein Tco_0333545, partial [Tanacetum coccineum]
SAFIASGCPLKSVFRVDGCGSFFVSSPFWIVIRCWLLGGVDGVSAGFIILAFSGSSSLLAMVDSAGLIGSINPCGGGGGAGKARSSLQSLVRELAWSPKHVMETVVDPSLKHML